MPTLRNPRHERSAEELATGKTSDAAYVLAGYKENRSNAARLGADRDVQARVAEIQSVGAERAAITVERLIVEAEQARSKAMSEKGGSAAAVAAITVKARLGMSLNSGIGNSMGRHKTGLGRRRSQKLDRSRARAQQSPA